MLFVFDVESVGLYGEAFAYGYVVVDRNFEVLEEGGAFCDQQCAWGTDEARLWVAENVNLDHLEEVSTLTTLRTKFRDVWSRWQEQGAVMVADCPFPVEAKWLLDVRGVFLKGDYMPPIYPLIDVGSALFAAGMNPLESFDRLADERPVHNPLCDSRQSLRVLRLALETAGTSISTVLEMMRQGA